MRYVTIYLAAMLLAALSGHFGVWQSVDIPVFSLLKPSDPPKLADNLVLVDVPYTKQYRDTRDPATFRRDVGALLRHLTRDPEKAPREVVLDMYFDKNPSGKEALLSGLAAARKRTRVFAGMNVDTKLDDYVGEHLQAAYEGLVGVGHTTFTHYSGLVWYDKELGRPSLPALPIAIQENANDLRDSPPARLVVPMGGEEAVRAITYCHAREVRCWKDAPFLGDLNLRDKRVIVGSFEADVLNPLNSPGPGILAWAISDVSAGKSSRALAPLDGAAAVAGITLALALLSAGAFFVGNRYARMRVVPARVPRALAAVALLSLAAGFLAWLALGMLLLTQKLVLPALLPWVSVLVATALAWRHAHHAAQEALYHASHDAETAPIEHDVFISYAHQPAENAAWVKQHVCEPLLAAKLKVFFDTGSIRRGRDWKREIDRAIAGSRVFLPVYSERYFESPQCADELAYAEQRRSSGSLTILPLTLVPMTAVPEIYRKVQATEAAQLSALLEEVLQASRGAAARPDRQTS